MDSKDQFLLARLERFLGPRYAWFTVALAVVLGVLLALAALAQARAGPYERAALWMAAVNPTIILYIFLLHPFMLRRWQRALQSLDALAPDRDGTRRGQPVNRRRESAVMLLGAVFGLVVARDVPGVEGWLRLYSEATSALVFALLGAVIYGSVARSRHLAAHSRAGLELHVFDAHLLTPFAQWGLSVSLVFVGGISLSLLFQSAQSLRSRESIVIYGSLVVVALTLFFRSLWTIHVALAKAREKELAKVRRDLAAAREALRRDRSGDSAGAMEDSYLPVVVCGIYEKQVLDASTWPFNPAIVGRLFASAAAPLGVYALKLAFGFGGAL